MWIVVVSLLFLLFILASVRPNRSSLSEFELRRRLDANEKGALLEWRRGELRMEIMTVRRVIIAFTLVVAGSLMISRYGWGLGLLFSLILVLVYNRAANIAVVRKIAQSLYDKWEDGFLVFVERRQRLIRLLSGPADIQVERNVASREELEHIITGLGDILTDDERKTLCAVLHFEPRQVKDHMTPRSVMEAIGVNELLGPLVLDNLHRTGHSHFPVFDGDIDHIVGMLHIHTLFNLSDRESKTVREVMEPRALFIHEEQTLWHALSACIKHRRHLLVVINDYRETVGVITIEDAVEQLIGRKIVDQFDAHDDLRAVAARNPRKFNVPTKPSQGSDV